MINIRNKSVVGFKLLRGNLPIEEEDQLQEPPAVIFSASAVGICIALGAIIFIGGLINATASETVDNKKAIYAIIGEAEDQGFTGMLAVAHAIRNRGTLKGVKGLNSPRVKLHLYSKKIYDLAQLAWEQSEIDFDITHGANHWANIKDFNAPNWTNDYPKTFEWNDHVFYKGAV